VCLVTASRLIDSGVPGRTKLPRDSGERTESGTGDGERLRRAISVSRRLLSESAGAVRKEVWQA
jgi:hypothetical protein